MEEKKTLAFKEKNSGKGEEHKGLSMAMAMYLFVIGAVVNDGEGNCVEF